MPALPPRGLRAFRGLPARRGLIGVSVVGHRVLARASGVPYLPRMLGALRRHPFAVEAFFRWSLVLTYAVPKDALIRFLAPGLELDTFEDLGFVAIALVQTEGLRPRGLPRILGRDFFLSGYRVFTRFGRPGRQTLRGLRILRSDTDRRAMVTLGNLFTHYGYRHADVVTSRERSRLEVRVTTASREADLHVEADLDRAELPEGTPFPSLDEARRFAGPLPYTFDWDAEAEKMIVVRGLRTAWSPRPVAVQVHEASFLDGALAGSGARLANAFFVEDVPYAWKAGELEALA